MKPAVICSLPVILLALIFSAFAQGNGGVASSPFSATPYRVGERLTYNVSFSSFPSVAHVELEVVSHGAYFGRDGILLRGHVQTTGVVNVALFAIDNDYATYVDPETGLPFHSESVVHQSSRSVDHSLDFTQPTSAIANPTDQSNVPGIYDFLSAFYRLRGLPLADGATYEFSIRDGGTDYKAELKISGRQTVKTNVGSYDAIASQVRVTNNSRANSYRLKIYFSDDERHVPVLITARVSAGEIRAELAGSEFVVPPTPTNTPIPPTPAAPTPTPALTPTPRVDNEAVNWPFKVGEQLNYQVFLAGSATPVASANFQVQARSRYFDRDGLLLTVKAQTAGVALRLFVANDQISSYVEPKTLLPFRTELNLIEGKRRLNQTLSINQDYGSATTAKGEKIEIPVGTHDYVSFFYAVRTFNLNPPRKNAISILVGNKPKTLFINSAKRETIEVGGQKILAIPISLTTDDSQADKYQLRMWVTDDKRRLPIRITGTTELGPFRADLVIIPATPQ